MISLISQKLALLALTLVLAIGAASAQPGDGDGRGDGRGRGEGFERGQKPGGNLERCLGSIELSDEQKAAIAALKERAANATSEIRSNIEALNQRLRTAKEEGDREAAAEIMGEIRE